jgi:hypothetical protein
MKLLKVFIALAILSIEISSVLAYNDVVRNSVSTAAGRIDYAMTYYPVASGTWVSTPVVNLHTTDSVNSAYITGITIGKAEIIDSYLFAVSSGGDFAATGMEAVGTDAVGKYASVTNYGMYGYVTNNFAFAGQYADEIKGQSIEMFSKAFNHIPVNPVAIAPPNTQAGFSTYADAPIQPGTGEHNSAFVAAGSLNIDRATNAFSRVSDPTAAAYTETTAYQFAQAGGSKDSTAYPMGMWAQAVNDRGEKLSTSAGANANDHILYFTYGQYVISPGHFMAALTDISQTGSSVIISPNAQSMGYADHGIVYSNEDSSLPNANSPAYSSASFNQITGTPYNTQLTDLPKPVAFGKSELFVYSIVNKNNPIGKSDAVFF